MLISRLPSGGKGGGELHGANIEVNMGSEFVGSVANLMYDGQIVSSKEIPSTLNVIFSDILEVGLYTIVATYSGIDYTDTVNITADNILRKDTLPAAIFFYSAKIHISAPEFIGDTVTLFSNGAEIASGVVDSNGEYLFIGITTAGVYIARITSYETTITVTEQNIQNNETINSAVTGDIVLTVGSIYSMSGYSWMCVEEINDYYVMIANSVTTGNWPGYIKNGNKALASGNIDGVNIAPYYTAIQTLYINIQSAEKIGATYGSGLFVVSTAKCNYVQTSTSGQPVGNISGNYANALKRAAQAWTGTNANWDSPGGYTAMTTKNNGTAVGTTQVSSGVSICPAFNLDKSKAYLDGTTILIK